jgi:hypothetical protein
MSTHLSEAKHHLGRPSSLLHLGLLLLGAAIGGASADAEPPPRRDGATGPDARRVELELKERTAAGATATLRATLGSAVGTPGQLALETSGGVYYKLRLRRDHGRVLHLELDRSQRGPGGEIKLQAAAALEAGKRALLARMTRPDGSALEITAALR